MATWYSVETPEERQRFSGAWSDGSSVLNNLELAGMLSEVAKEQVLAHAGAEPDGADWENNPPYRFVWAQLQHVKALWNAGRGGMNVNTGEFEYATRPLTKDIQDIIRPPKGVADVY